MQEELIIFQTAKLAKEKGIDCVDDTLDYIKAFYSEKEDDFDEIEISRKDIVVYCYYSRPTQSLLQRWLREKHDIFISVVINANDDVNIIMKSYNNTEYIYDESLGIKHVDYHTFDGILKFSSYEQALEQGLLEALKLIKIEKL